MSPQVRTFAAPAFFAFHFANAYETADGKEIRMDMGLYRDPEIVNQLALQPLADFPGAWRRWLGGVGRLD